MRNILLLLIFSPLLVFSQFQIGHRTITFNDPTRSGGFGSGGGPGRQIQTEIYYPSYTSGENTPVATFPDFPVIVFGHGFAMGWDAYQNIWEHLVPQGYIMAFVRTEGSLIPAPSHADFGADLALVVTKMLALNTTAGSPFNGTVKQKAVIMGHSMGGGATMLAAANNTSIAGIVGLAPAETNPTAIGVCPNITVPALIFSGSSDGVTPPAEHHIPIYQGIASTCKSFVSITGGAHCYFANPNFNCDFGEGTSSQGISISRVEQQQLTYAILDPWLQYVLGSDCFALTDFQWKLNNTIGTVNQGTCAPSGTNATIFYDNMSTLWTTTPGTTYQWYLNGQIMQGETNDSLVPPVDLGGDYSVSVFSPSGCETSSFITLQGSVNALPMDYQLIYQAAENIIQITTNAPYTGSVSLQDIHGRIIQQEVVNAKSMNFSSSQLSKGVYFVRLGNLPAKRILVY
jgi:pimeloyl-ACP methyl ester carboxylesterase